MSLAETPVTANRAPCYVADYFSLAVGLCLLVGCSTMSARTTKYELADDGPLVRGQSDEPDGLLGSLNPKYAYQKAKNAVGLGPNEEVAREAFKQAEQVFIDATSAQGNDRKKRFREAADLYDEAADRWPDSSLEENSLFMKGESLFFADRYPASAEAFELLVKKYPNTKHIDTVDQRRFAMGRYWIQHQEANPDWPITPNVTSKDRPTFDKFGHGVRVLDKIRFDDPTGKLADDATMAAAVAHFRAGNYHRADDLFDDLRRSFPNSEHQFQAHLLGLKCKLKTFQGPQYSQLPMEEAEGILKQIFRQFPQEAETEREFLNNAWKEVRMNRAIHDWEMAKYYDQRKEFAAARRYYDKVRRDFSDTSLATEANDRLAEIGDRPAKPDQPLPWLAELFPTPEREKPLVARNPLNAIQR